MNEQVRTLRLHQDDNVLVCIDAVAQGCQLAEGSITTLDDIPAGHKVATATISRGCPVVKYSRSIGIATRTIRAGEHVHEHNCEVGEQYQNIRTLAHAERSDSAKDTADVYFNGYIRSDGRIATRNYIGILTSVNCSATVARQAAAYFTPERLAAYPEIDGVVALTHGNGCAIAKNGEGMDVLQRVLAGYMTHPNFAAVVVIGLGCETNQIQSIFNRFDMASGPQLHSINIQDAGGSAAALRQVIEHIETLVPEANNIQRQPVPVSALKLALQCGGSDAFSGITANPALGAASDLLIRKGGTAIISETPEIYGAEHLLTARANPEVAELLNARLRWWEDYTKRNGGSLDNNPSFGNKQGGLTTILEKSLGAVAKAGSTPLKAFYLYGEHISESGLVMMDSPGYDPCSVTGQIASGANIVCFTTGRGSVSGFKPAPCLKLCSNSETYRMLEMDMDINCGLMLDESLSTEEMGRIIFDHIVRVASGEKTASEIQGFGDNEFVPWTLGAIT